MLVSSLPPSFFSTSLPPSFFSPSFPPSSRYDSYLDDELLEPSTYVPRYRPRVPEMDLDMDYREKVRFCLRYQDDEGINQHALKSRLWWLYIILRPYTCILRLNILDSI